MHPIKILILTTNPSDTDRLQLPQEIREIETEIEIEGKDNVFNPIAGNSSNLRAS